MKNAKKAAVTPKTKAKILSGIFSEKGIQIKHSEALEMIARLEGFKNWNVYSASLKSEAFETENFKEPVEFVSLSSYSEEFKLSLSFKASIDWKEVGCSVGELNNYGEISSGYFVADTVRKVDEVFNFFSGIEDKEAYLILLYKCAVACGVVTHFEFTYPDAEKYGTPDIVTSDNGVREHIIDCFGCKRIAEEATDWVADTYCDTSESCGIILSFSENDVKNFQKMVSDALGFRHYMSHWLILQSISTL